MKDETDHGGARARVIVSFIGVALVLGGAGCGGKAEQAVRKEPGPAGPVAAMGQGVHAAGGFRAFATKNLTSRGLGVRLRVEADAGLEARVVGAFDLGWLEIPIRYAVTGGESFEAGGLGEMANLLRLQLALSRVNERTVATLRGEAGEAGAVARDLAAELVE